MRTNPFSVWFFIFWVGVVAGLSACDVDPTKPEANDQRAVKQLELMQRKAKAGDPMAQHNLGLMYEAGTGTSPNIKEAFKWYLASAKQGYAQAQYDVGWVHYKGEGVTQDDASAVSWFRKAAEQGYAPGQNHLGLMYKKGRGVTRNYGEAFKWYERAALQGDETAHNNLAWLLATCPDAAVRNGARAVSMLENREKAADVDTGELDTLAAAYAELGRFDRAIPIQERAVVLLKSPATETLFTAYATETDRLKNFQLRLISYQEQKPWREE